MSGINELKRKTKMSLDELYEGKTVGKTVKQKESNPERKEETQPDSQNKISQSSQEISHPTNQLDRQMENNLDVRQESHSAPSVYLNAKPQMQKMQTYKMTFNLTEDVYKAFNDLYAQRMLQGRKTDKSDMICEAIHWLIQMDNEQRQ